MSFGIRKGFDLQATPTLCVVWLLFGYYNGAACKIPEIMYYLHRVNLSLASVFS
jgi:hypothetical protein